MSDSHQEWSLAWDQDVSKIQLTALTRRSHNHLWMDWTRQFCLALAVTQLWLEILFIFT